MLTPMAELTSKQRKFLRSHAHSLKAIVQVGQRGLTAPVIQEVDGALAAHELLKVRLGGEREERGQLAERLAAATRAENVGEVGRVVLLYRPHPDPKHRRIRLPT